MIRPENTNAELMPMVIGNEWLLIPYEGRTNLQNGVYWGTVCEGNKKKPTKVGDGPCYHTFSMTKSDNLVTIYQSIIDEWTMAAPQGITSYTDINFAWTMGKALSKKEYEPDCVGLNCMKTRPLRGISKFKDIFGYDPTEEHDFARNGPPQVRMKGPFPDVCAEIPTLASFDFKKNNKMWGKANEEGKVAVNWPITKVHSQNTMGPKGEPNGGWMKNYYCNGYGTSKILD